jgi:hypothetical protein
LPGMEPTEIGVDELIEFWTLLDEEDRELLAGAGVDSADPVGPGRAELRPDDQVRDRDPTRNRLDRGDPAAIHPFRVPPDLSGDVGGWTGSAHDVNGRTIWFWRGALPPRTVSRASENVRAARLLSGACQGCQIPVRKNRVRAGQGHPKPQQVEPADRNPDKKRGTPTPGSVPETCQERTTS